MATTPVTDLKVGDTFTTAYDTDTYTIDYLHPAHRSGRNYTGFSAIGADTGKSKGFTFPNTATVNRTA